MKISPDCKKLIMEGLPALVATASKSGKPNVSAKGSLKVIDDEHLVFADIRSPRTVANIRENPQVAVLCLNPSTRKGCRIWGHGEVLTSGEVFDQYTKDYAARNMKVNSVVQIAADDVVAF